MTGRHNVLRCAMMAVMLASPLRVCFSQDAKTLHDQGMNNPDSCQALKQLCDSAKLNSKWQKDCEQASISVSNFDGKQFDKASGFLDKKEYASAQRYAKQVCAYDKSFADKAAELMNEIKTAQTGGEPQPPKEDDQSKANLSKAKNSFDAGNLDAAAAAAGLVHDPALKDIADDYSIRVLAYKRAMQSAQQSEASDIPGAISNYQKALGISSNGPGDPAAQIKRLSQVLETKKELPPQPPSTQQAHVDSPPTQRAAPSPPEDRLARAAKLVDDAKRAEQSNLQLALTDYQAAARLDPKNNAAQDGMNRVGDAIKNKPEEQAKTLAAAIRNFYSYHYDAAEDELSLYVSSKDTKHPGAARFYQGATRLYKNIVESSAYKQNEVVRGEAVQGFFKQARAAGYQPLPKYLSPVMQCAWEVSGGSSGCSR